MYILVHLLETFNIYIQTMDSTYNITMHNVIDDIKNDEIKHFYVKQPHLFLIASLQYIFNFNKSCYV